MAIDPLWIFGGLGALGSLGSLFGGGGADHALTVQGRQGAETQNQLLKNLLQQQYLTNLTPEMAGTMGSEMQMLLNMLGNAAPGAQAASSQQTDAYTQALQQMMRYGMQSTGQSNVSLLNELQNLVGQGLPTGQMFQNQQQLRDLVMQNALSSQLTPDQQNAQQQIMGQALAWANNPMGAWGVGPNIAQLTNPGNIQQVSGGSPWDIQQVSGGTPWNIQQVTPQSAGGLSDVFSGQLQRQAAAQLAAQGINSPALSAEAAAQAAAPYQQQMNQFAAQQDLQAQLANQSALQQMQSQLSGQGLSANLANQSALQQMMSQLSGQGLQAGLANQQANAADIARQLGIQEQNVQNQLTGAGMSENLFNTILGLPSTLGPGTGPQAQLAAMASQLYGQPMFDLSQLANVSQMTPANPYSQLFQMTSTMGAPGPSNLEGMLGQLYGMMQNRSQTSGVPTQVTDTGGGVAPNFMGLLPLMMAFNNYMGGGGMGGMPSYGGGWGGGPSGGTLWTGAGPDIGFSSLA